MIRSFTTPKLYPFFVTVVLFLIVAGLGVFMTSYAFPQEEGWMSIYISSRAGGSSFIMETADFAALNTGVLIATAIVAATALFLSLRAKRRELFYFLVALFGLFILGYVGVFLGNAFDELWGLWWLNVLGVVVPLLFSIAITFPLILPMTGKNTKRP